MSFRRKRAFTLVEIMIVVLLIGVIASIAVPSWMRSRDRSRRLTCLANMHAMDNAKDLYAIANRRAQGDPVNSGDLFDEFLKGQIPACPAGGSYTIGTVGDPVVCTLHGTVTNPTTN